MTVARQSKVRTGPIAIEVTERDPAELFADNYLEYGRLTLEDRALPDFRDGLLKVYRRTLWSMHDVAKSKPVKTARVVGDTLGKYHPHGDAPVAGAVENMVWMPHSPVDGIGNWGGQNDDAAAMRYTNCSLSEYAREQLFHLDYLPTINCHPNYDGKDVEPELLPALLPNVILNGTTGVGVGLNTTVPSFRLDGVIKLLKGMLAGKKLTAAQAAKYLEFTFPYGGWVPKEEYNEDAILNIMKTGKASVYTCPDYDVRADRIVLTGIPPRMTVDKLMANLRDSGHFTAVQDEYGRDSKTPSDIHCMLKRGLKGPAVVEQLLDENWFFALVPFQLAVIERRWDETKRGIVADIYQWGVVELLERWLEWRLGLEDRMLVARIDQLDRDQARKNLLLLAQENRKLIATSWEFEDQEQFLMAKLKLSVEDVKYIVGLRLSQLAKMDREKLQRELKELADLAKAAKTQRKDLPGSVLARL